MFKKIAFMGTPNISVPILKSLYQNGYPICAVYTQPPKSSMRGQKINKSPIQSLAENFNLNIRSPNFLNQNKEELEYFKSLNMSKFQIIKALIWDARYSLITVSLAGFGRGIAEVGAVIIVGGNINHFTRVMTTSIALETSMGNLPFALALGIILLLISLSVNALVMALNLTSKRYAFA